MPHDREQGMKKYCLLFKIILASKKTAETAHLVKVLAIAFVEHMPDDKT